MCWGGAVGGAEGKKEGSQSFCKSCHIADGVGVGIVSEISRVQF